MNVNYLVSKFRYPCDCPACACPAAGGGRYTFRYIRDSIVYYDVPKCASTTIRRALFGEDERDSMNNLPFPGRGRTSFSFVRNPWDRAISNWRMFTTKPGRIAQLESMGGSADMDFEAFLIFARSKWNHHWLPQSRFVPKTVDFLGRLECFEEDFSALLSKIGVSANFGHLNRAGIKDYRSDFSERTRALVEEMYSIDIKRFGYTF